MAGKRTFPFVSQVRLEAHEEGRAEGREQGRAEGRIAGFAEGILMVFDHRGIEVDDASRDRITSCADTAALKLWLDRSFAVATADELFA